MIAAIISGMRNRFVSRHFAALFLIYLAGLFAILRANRLYLDDLGRALYGYADWVESARPLAELLSYIFYLGHTTVDASPLSQILAAALLALASLILFDAVRARPSWGALLCTVPVGLSPYQLENLSYRFDAPWMGLAIVLAVLPWSFYRAGRWSFFFIAAICIFASLSLYQPAIGAYLAVAVYRLLVDLSSRKCLSFVGKCALRLAMPFVFGAGTYALQVSFWLRGPQYGEYVSQHSSLPPLAVLPARLMENIIHYFSLLLGDWRGNGIGVLLGIIITVFTLLLFIRQIRNLRAARRCLAGVDRSEPSCLYDDSDGSGQTSSPAPGARSVNELFRPAPAGRGFKFVDGIRILLLFLLIPCLLMTPFGIQFVLDNPVWPPRTFQGFGVMASLMLLYVHAATPEGVVRRAFLVLQIFFTLQLLIFAQVYGNLLDAQGQWEMSRIGLLASDLNRFIRKTGSSRVDFIGSVELSPLVHTPASKYPLLGRLVAVPLTRDWRWGYEQLITYGVKLDREDVPDNIPPGSFTPFLETPNYRIDVTPDGVGRITFLPPPTPKPLKKKPQPPQGKQR